MSISSLVNNCKPFELLSKQALIKSFREAVGQVKNVADTTVNASTTLVTEGELGPFFVKKGERYLVQGRFMISTGATPGAKLQVVAPNLTTSATIFRGKALATQGTANVAGVTLNDNSSLNANLFSSAVAYSSITVDGLLIPEADDYVTIKFAQSVSDASDTILLRGSSMRVVQLKSSFSATVPSSI